MPKVSKGIRSAPQNINEGAWYYESKGSITVIVWINKQKRSILDDGCLSLRIPSKLLRETLKRQDYVNKKTR